MTKDQGRGDAPNELKAILDRIQKRAAERGFPEEPEPDKPRPTHRPKPVPTATPEAKKPTPERALVDPNHTRYDHGLAEFPAFRFGRRRRSVTDRIEYADTIRGVDGKPLERRWTTYPAVEGYGGSTTHTLLFHLHQLWKEQCFAGQRITFGTMRSLCHRLYPHERVNDLRYAQLRRDLDILCGYTFDCENAFWDPGTKAYGHMRRWSIFTGWFEVTRSKPGQTQLEIPMGFIEVSETYARIAKQRGFFVTGFEESLFHVLTPHEQRLALYLSKMFVTQKVHRRHEADLYAALPIEGGELKKKRQTLRKTANGLIEKGYPNLERFSVEKHSSTGNWLATFHRKKKVAQDRPLGPYSLDELEPVIRLLVEDILELTKDAGSVRFYVGAIQALGEQAVRAGLSELRHEMTVSPGRIRRPGGWLAEKLIETGKSRGIEFTKRKGRPAKRA